jgi:hypothetical protein
MPTKQTKESIEAELNASDVERIALQLQEVASPHFSRCLLECCGKLTSAIPQPAAVIWA